MIARPVIKSLREINDEEILAICSLKNQHWPHSLDSQLQWWKEHTDESDVFFFLDQDNLVLAFLRLRSASVKTNKELFSAFCATEVCVDQRHQGKGLGTQLFSIATTYISNTSPFIAYLLCWNFQANFYRACGWRQISFLRIKSLNGLENRLPRANERCMVYDPSRRLNGQVVLFGNTF